jgi:hypothetical protein
MKANQNSKILNLGAMVEKLFEQGSTVADDAVAAADLAARRLERVLVRGGNARLAFALADLALELAPVSPRRYRRIDTRSFSSARAA